MCNETCLELPEGLSYGGFELLRVKLQSMYERNPPLIDGGLNKSEVRVTHLQQGSELPGVNYIDKSF